LPKHAVSPLAPAAFPPLPAIAGVRLATGNSGTRYRGRDDLLLIEFAAGTAAAGLFTRSSMPGAPVDWCRAQLARGRGRARALVVNAGIANVFTGRAGREATEATATAAAALVGCRKAEVFLASTGVIGQILPGDKVAAALPALSKALAPERWRAAAEAICTTDTFAKGASATALIDGVPVTVNGIAKGSGMIAPDMATMLAFLATDARLPAGVLQGLLRDATGQSFNCLTVDGDTSTSDTVLLFATGQARHRPASAAGDPRLRDFRRALAAVTADLARQIACDGEGAQKLVTVTVTGAASARAARAIALGIANSPLVKTAIAGGDANWGRIVMAVGKSGQRADRDRLAIRIGGQLVTENGMVRPDYDDAAANAHFRGREVEIAVDVGVGRGRARVWTCDLTHGYIDINAAYRS
jgi:glutamate N-acetyltransferase/amino-acid N-acetyltransferase